MVTKKDFIVALEILQSIEHNGYRLFYLGEEVINYDLEGGRIMLKDTTIIKYSDFLRTSEILESFTINIKADEILRSATEDIHLSNKQLRRFLLKLGLETDRKD